MIPNIIDEIPVISVAAAFAEGLTEISGAEELRFKECDRIKAITDSLSKAGVDIKAKKDGLLIKGNKSLKLKPCIINSYDDHRIAMSSMVLSLKSKEKIKILKNSCINTSFTDFVNILFDAVTRERV